MRRNTILILTLAVVVCACAPPKGPRVRPGLWRQTIHMTGTEMDPNSPPEPVVSEICVGSSGLIEIPYYRANSSNACAIDTFARTAEGGWTSRTVCQHAELGQITVTAVVSGDMRDSYNVVGHVTLANGSQTFAQVGGRRIAACPTTMRAGDERAVGP